jgi:plastocyanin
MARVMRRAWLQVVRRLAVGAAAAGVVLALGGSSAHAAGVPGSLNFDHSGTACRSTSGHNLSTNPKMSQTGIALIGDDLYISCWGDTTITEINPHTGSELNVYTISAGSYLAFGALAYDPTDGTLWACASRYDVGTSSPENQMSEVGTIDLGSQTFTPVFQSHGCDNGLAWDPGTTPARQDTLWTSGDTDTLLYDYSQTGQQLESDNLAAELGPNPASSGMAIGGGNFYVADPSSPTKRVFQVSTNFTSSTQVLSSTHRYEDLECDDQTYAPQTVIWVMWFNQNILKPLPISGTCDQTPPPPSTLQLTQSANSTVTAGQDVDFTDTATNTDQLNPQTDLTISQPLASNATYAGVTPSAGGSCSTTATTVSCSFPLLPAGASASMDVSFGTLIPGSVSSPPTAQSDSQGPVSASPPASVNVTAAAGFTYVTVADGGITPATPEPALGDTTQFVIEGSSPHEIADDTGLTLFDSGQLAPPAAYDVTFPASGAYKVIDPTTGHTATVQVATGNPLNASLSDGAFSVSWAVGALPMSCVEDVQVMAPGGSWATFKKGTSDIGDPYTPTRTGTYKFRARLRCGGHSTAYSTGNSTKVS